MTLSIDIGKTNLGFSIWKETITTFGLYNITKEVTDRFLPNTNENRSEILCYWLNDICEKNEIHTIVVEKQVFSNPSALCLQFVICGFCYGKHIKYIPFDARKKFVITEEPYDSKKKEHKKLVVKYAINILEKYHSDLLSRFKLFGKKDDISDSICMLFITASGLNSEELRKIMLGL